MNVREPIVIHYVTDMNRALRFYRDVIGLEVVEESPGWSQLRCNGCMVALHAWGSDLVVSPQAGLNLLVDDVDAAAAEVTAGGGLVKTVREGGPVRLAEVSDPDGNCFELRQMVDA